jgi:hypothetical protein
MRLMNCSVGVSALLKKAERLGKICAVKISI